MNPVGRPLHLLLLLLCAWAPVPESHASEKPNILFIAVDDLRDDWLTGMTKPVKAGEKKWTPGMSTAKKKKLTPEQKQKARDEERAKKKAEKL